MLWWTSTRFEPLQLETIAELEEELFGEFRRTWPKLPPHTDIRKAPPPRPPPRQGWMLMRGDELIGYVSYIDHISHMYADSFGIKPGYRGQGYGTMLGLKFLEDADQCYRMVVAMVRKDHYRTEELYSRAGFDIAERNVNVMSLTKMVRVGAPF